MHKTFRLFQRWAGGLFKNPTPNIDNDFFKPIFFEFSDVIKKDISSNLDLSNLKRDYLAKEYNIQKYVFDGCEQLQVIGTSYIKYKRELTRYSNDELNEKIGNVIGRNFEIEARLALRRSMELLIESWYFKEIKENRENILRKFFLIRNLKAFYKRNNNSKTFCNFPLESDIKAIKEIRLELNSLPALDLFYLNPDKNYNDDKDVKDLTVSFRNLLKDALLKMSDGLREIIGSSYQLYPETSEVIHGFSGGPKFNLKNYHNEIIAIYGRTAVLASNILKYLIVIGDGYISNKDIIDEIKGIETDQLPPDYNFNVGDKVLVCGQVKGEIIDISLSDYGCKKYKVKFNDKRGMWDFKFEREYFLLKELTKIKTPDPTTQNQPKK